MGITLHHFGAGVNPAPQSFSIGEIAESLKNKYYFPIVLTVSPEQEQKAQDVAAARQQGKATRKSCNDLGSMAANLRADFWGALGELLIFDTLRPMNLPLEIAPLVSRYSVPQADLCFMGIAYEIKTVPFGKNFVTINAQQHQKCRCDFYLPVHFTGQRQARMCCPIAHQEVSAWSRRDDRHSPYFSHSASELEPLYSWMQLPEREVQS